MPLFRRKVSDPAVSPVETTHHTTTTTHAPEKRSSMFGRRRSPVVEPESVSPTRDHHRNSKLMHRHEDASITSAREQIIQAEAAEREADKALIQARTAVKEARARIKLLEREAAEQARLAKIKQHTARDMSKRAKPLGRHDHL